MRLETRISELVSQLRRIGPKPSERLIELIVEQGAAARGSLLELATDVQTLQEPDPVCWGPLHALRLLGEIPDIANIQPLLKLLPIEVYAEDDEASNLWASEVVQIIGRCGASAEAVLWKWVDEPEHTASSRGAAVHALAYAATVATEMREQLIASLRSRLDSEHDPVIAAYLVNALAELGVEAAYKQIMAAYRAGRVDSEIMPASVARQLLLGGGHDLLNCANHSFWERYDHHGPFPSDSMN